MAFRMQSSVPELTDLKQESDKVKKMYGPEVDTPGTFANCCILARRMMERDVTTRAKSSIGGWDQHGALPKDIRNQCRDIDQPATALVQDLKQRGMLDDTLVVWGGEFGRTVYCQGALRKDDYGRDHHPKCFTMWMAGGGNSNPESSTAKRTISATTSFKDPVSVRDLNATILNQLGIDHERLTYKFQGLDHRLTGVEEKSRVVNEILA